MAEDALVRINCADGTPIAVHVLGEGSALVCLPGGPARASAYLEDLAGLTAYRTLLRVDLRGTGMSPLPEDRDSLAFHRLADDIEDLREERGLETVELLAHSAGCFVALAYAAAHPDRVARLVLVTPSARPFGDVESDIATIRAGRSDEPWYAEAAAIEKELELAPARMRHRMDPALRVFGYARWDDRAQEHAASTDSQMSMRAMAAFAPSPEVGASLDLPGRLQAVTAPVLVVVGHLDGITGVKAGHFVAAMLPDAQVVELADCAHYPWIDSPDAFREAVVSFLSD
ncbi:MAG TPA: alpha/beta hydrolase [Mycobacteriales bacterium]|nr:alpha/beta hydrolase [Mycobacteriales bacterium]